MIETPVFASAAVAAPHHLAAEAGRAVLAEGGNAIEAMVAMAAVIAVVYPHMNGLGGDGFWLVRSPGGRVRGVEACGPAGALASIARYRDREFDSIPPRGPDAALTVAGTVGGWTVALDMARALGGRMPLRDLLAQARTLAREGCPVSPSEAACQPHEQEALLAAPGFAALFLHEGERPKTGTIRTNRALADLFEHLAGAGLDDFYRGDIGREIAADLARIGAPIVREDLERYRAREVAPLSLKVGDAVLYNLPPPTQGLAALMTLGIADRVVEARAGETARQHALIEAVKRAFAVRDRVCVDPASSPYDPTDFLTDQALAAEAGRIDPRRAAPTVLPPSDGDTVWMGAVDGSGLAVSFIQSIYWEYGSGCVLPATGLHWQNRGVAFSLDRRSPHALHPGRKPFHTLNPALATFDDGRVACYGSMGGDGQPQFQAQVLTRYRAGGGAAAAVDAPRWLLGRTWGAESATLKVESRFDPAVVEGLERLGHEIEQVDAPYSSLLGHAGLVVRRPRDGAVEATHDSRSDGGAAGL